MGSVHHHQTQARRFLSLARSDHNSGKYDRAANALARAASHAATAALFHCALLRRPTRRKLTNTLFILADAGQISNGGVRIFRNIYQLPDQLSTADPRQCQRLSRRARNRVAALIRSVEGAIAGRPTSGRGRRNRPPRRPAPTCVSEIIALPDYKEIAAAHNLVGAPLSRRPDPHGFYARGETPRECPCHPVPLPLRDDRDTIECHPCGSAPWSAPSASPSPTPSPSVWPPAGNCSDLRGSE